jgi:predicted metal-dependent hydrolase
MTSLLPSYRHVINPKLKHTYLSFDDEGTLVIKSPKVSSAYIEALLLKKSAWIRRTQKKLAEKKGRTDAIFHGEELFYLGNPYRIDLQKHPTQRTVLVKEEEGYTLFYHTYDIERFKKEIDRFYKQEAERIIPPLVSVWAEKMRLSPEAVRFRKTKRQWGSCSSRNILSFNTMLVKLPLEVIEYVVVHELAHIRHKHHQQSFWSLVAQTMPDYKARVAQLHTYTPQ